MIRRNVGTLKNVKMIEDFFMWVIILGFVMCVALLVFVLIEIIRNDE